MREINIASDNPYYSSQGGILYNKNKTELLYCPEGKTGLIRIPDGVTKIALNSFSWRNYVDILIIPPSVMEISSVPYGAFIQCTKGSAAEAYAKKHNIDYYACDPEDLNNNGGTAITPQPKPQPQPAPTVPKNGVKNNRLYKNGKKVTGTKVVKVGKKTYYIKNGKVQKGKKAVKYKNKLYAVNNGVVMTAKKTRVVKVGKKSYIVSRKGIVSHPKKGYKQYKVGKKKYIVNKSGVIQKNKKRIRIGKRIYRTNKKGIVVKVTKRK